METDATLPSSQESGTGTCPEPDESNPQFPKYFFKIRFNIFCLLHQNWQSLTWYSNWGTHSLQSSGYRGFFSRGGGGICRGVNLTTRFHLEPRLIMRGAIPPIPQYSFMARCSVKSTGTTLLLLANSFCCLRRDIQNIFDGNSHVAVGIQWF